MKLELSGLGFGVAFGFLLAWSRLSDPGVIRDMLLLEELDVFLLMGSAVAVAAVGVRMLRALKARAAITGDAIQWSVERPSMRHFVGSALFGTGWAIAGTCPGPVAAMIGQGHFSGLAVAAGLVGGVLIQRMVARPKPVLAAGPEAAGL
jgi:uncharacterized protein